MRDSVQCFDTGHRFISFSRKVDVCCLLDILAEYRKSCRAEDLDKLKLAVCTGESFTSL